MNLQTNPSAIALPIDRPPTSPSDTSAPHAKPAEAVVLALDSNITRGLSSPKRNSVCSSTDPIASRAHRKRHGGNGCWSSSKISW